MRFEHFAVRNAGVVLYGFIVDFERAQIVSVANQLNLMSWLQNYTVVLLHICEIDFLLHLGQFLVDAQKRLALDVVVRRRIEDKEVVLLDLSLLQNELFLRVLNQVADVVLLTLVIVVF